MINSCAINKVILMGRITSDPEMRQTTTGSATCRFTVAVDRGVNSSNPNERSTDFISVTAWEKNAEFVSRYMSKGRLVLVEGNLRTGSYADKRYPDVTHYTCEVVAERVAFGETKSSAQGHGGYTAAPQQYQYGNQQPQQSNYNNNQQYGNNPQYGNNSQQYNPAPAQPPQEIVSMGDFEDFQVIGGGDGTTLPF